ncbi:hypothetical protein [Nocardioides sp. GY 10127]|uniref:hypothetical protein n=1 Tax=Nocardioides sp. GY 10127 TaxID=2569762 RepID=UPI0010A7C12D|nr:hypothetical protein [Nocardioides sp. GY 10127]TIC86487.1 hypothetical protein E8D37_00870 [Nocardioides sp. GY 10127]
MSKHQSSSRPGVVRGQRPLSTHRRVAHGVYVERPAPGVRDDPRCRLIDDLRALLLVLPPGATFTHVTAAAVLGWSLPKLPDVPPVFASVGDRDPRPRRPGLICSRLRRSHLHEEVLPASVRGAPVPVDHPAEILLRAARDLGTIDLVILADSARRLGHVTEESIRPVLESGRPGVRQLKRAWELSDPRAESPGETLLRLLHHVAGASVTPQVELYDEGRFLGRVDLLLDGAPSAHEYDGGGHRGEAQHRRDLRRERLLQRKVDRRGYVLDDLLNRPHAVLDDIDRALQRKPDPAREAAWRRLVDNSMYGAGYGRVIQRWRRLGGFDDWSGTRSTSVAKRGLVTKPDQ